MYGDTKYEFVQSGSTTASAATAHSVFGTYNGLSLLNQDDVLHIQVLPLTNNFELLKSAALGTGMLFTTDTKTYYDIPPMRVGSASQLHFRNQTGASNATVRWTAWRRIG